MSGLEVNKILASIILAILVVTVIGHLGDILIDVEHHEMEAGHGGKSGRDGAIEDIAIDYAFILKIANKINE